ncbi:MAG: response regulator [Planctomycetales bacterium]|nr:response regulator [Planctomycetales bacterium]MBN8625335.1 response regulator [Planctomycetota bacterium]
MSEPFPDSATADADGSRRLTRYYILALSAVAVLSIAGQLFVQARLVEQLGDSKLVNTAGRQRMLSQRIVKCALVLNDRPSPAEQSARADELRSSLELWRRCHDELRRGDAAVGHSDGNSPAAAAIFTRLEPTFAALSTAAGRIAADPNVAHPADLATLLSDERAFLEGMDAVVAQYEREAQARVARLRIIESVLLLLTLGTLLVEGMYVFRPAAGQIRRSFAALVRLGKELRTARDVAESANRAKSQFLTNVSHELRTPLHAILGAVEMAQSTTPRNGETPGEARTAEALELIQDSARRQLALVNDLLDLSRIEAGRLRLDDGPFDLHELLHDTAAMIRPLAAARGLRFSLDLADDLPRRLQGDPLRIGQILTNLLGNAVKFTDHGDVSLRSYVRHVDDGREVRFVVRDTGLGIAPDRQQAVFESFVQIGEAASARQGAGLGLAISRQLAELMRGQLEVESRPGQGSTFTFSLPCVECAASEQAGTITVPQPLEGAKQLNVLVVDDSPAGRRVLEAMLAELGHSATCCADGHAAVDTFERAALEQSAFDVVLLDVNMPGIDGRATAAELRRREAARSGRSVTIIFVTADATFDASATDKNAADGLLLKPFSRHEVEDALNRVGKPIATPAAKDAAPANADDSTPRDRALARLGGNPALLNELSALFLEESPRQFDLLTSAVEEGRYADVAFSAHLLHGQLAMLEQPDATLLLELETAARQGDTDECVRLAALVRERRPQISDEVEKLTTLLRVAGA